MRDFLGKLATILEVPEVNPDDTLQAFTLWDSLVVLSVIAMVDADYGINLRAGDFSEALSAADLWATVESRKS